MFFFSDHNLILSQTYPRTDLLLLSDVLARSDSGDVDYVKTELNIQVLQPSVILKGL